MSNIPLAPPPVLPAPNILAIRLARRIKIQGEQLAVGQVPRSCRDLGRINPEAILHAAWLIQVARQAEEAARAYDVVAVELFGEFARPNFPSKASQCRQQVEEVS